MYTYIHTLERDLSKDAYHLLLQNETKNRFISRYTIPVFFCLYTYIYIYICILYIYVYMYTPC